jgi:hypothetical protein
MNCYILFSDGVLRQWESDDISEVFEDTRAAVNSREVFATLKVNGEHMGVFFPPEKPVARGDWRKFVEGFDQRAWGRLPADQRAEYVEAYAETFGLERWEVRRVLDRHCPRYRKVVI